MLGLKTVRLADKLSVSRHDGSVFCTLSLLQGRLMQGHTPGVAVMIRKRPDLQRSLQKARAQSSADSKQAHLMALSHSHAQGGPWDKGFILGSSRRCS